MRMMALSKVYQLLEPGPVVLLTTAARGAANVMTMSWYMMVEFEPPQVACVVSSANYSFVALRDRRECVIAIPSADLAPIVVRSATRPAATSTSLQHRGLTPLLSTHVAAPLVKECFANLECKVIDMRLVNKYNLFILSVLKALTVSASKAIHHCGYSKFIVDGETVKLKSQMR